MRTRMETRSVLILILILVRALGKGVHAAGTNHTHVHSLSLASFPLYPPVNTNSSSARCMLTTLQRAIEPQAGP
jgi:hypothetical protein